MFERGAFGTAETVATASALAVYATGLPAYILVKGLTPGFFAREDTATPVKIGIFAVVVNLILNLVLMKPFLHIGIAAATSVSAWVNAILLTYILYRRHHFIPDSRLKSRLSRMILASAFMAGLLYAGMLGLNGLLAGSLGQKSIALSLLVVGGLIIYAHLALLFRFVDKKDLMRVLRRDKSTI